MPYRPDRQHRRSIRLRGYDYAQPGAYFVTLCTQGSLPLLGEVADGAMSLSAGGCAIEAVWLALSQRFADLRLDAHCLMPDHLHGIVILGDCPDLAANPVDAAGHGATERGQRLDGQRQALPLQEELDVGADLLSGHMGGRRGQRQALPLQESSRSARPSLGDVMQAFKSLSTRSYMQGVREQGWTAFAGRLWQRNYWERIIRNERELLAIRDYIARNPRSWAAREHLQ